MDDILVVQPEDIMEAVQLVLPTMMTCDGLMVLAEVLRILHW